MNHRNHVLIISFLQKNVIEVPVVCPPGQQADNNGRCRPIWRKSMEKLMEMLNRYRDCVEQNPENARAMCPPQWEMLQEENTFDGKSVIETPVVCPAGQKPDKNGRCRDIFYLRGYNN